MNVRELIEVLGAGDLDAEVYVAADGLGERGRPVETVEDVRLALTDTPVCLLMYGVRPPRALCWPVVPDGLPLGAWGNGRRVIEAPGPEGSGC